MNKKKLCYQSMSISEKEFVLELTSSSKVPLYLPHTVSQLIGDISDCVQKGKDSL